MATGSYRSMFRLIAAGLVTGVLSGAALAQQTPNNTVLAAENALYGAGYDIGTADGQMDSQLRAAVKSFQSKQSGLSATGELDDDTLYALGVKWDASAAAETQQKAAPKPKPAKNEAKPEAAKPEPQKKEEKKDEEDDGGWLFVW
ncbi:peptidoglycan-binding domain-containing protein [Marinobacteraceae bacterium S3BR75-40.1]